MFRTQISRWCCQIRDVTRKRSRERNPLHLGQSTLEGQFPIHAGRVDEALIRLRNTSDPEPKFWLPHFIAASAYLEK